MLVKEVMTREVECVSPDDTLQHAAQMMKSLDIGPVPVCDNDRLAGMLTDRDIVLRCIAEGGDARTAKVREAMSEGVTYCFEDDDISEASRLMQEKQIHRVVVLDRDKHLAGIVSLGDLATEPEAKQDAARVLEEVSRPAR